jgi:hypothetical protein
LDAHSFLHAHRLRHLLSFRVMVRDWFLKLCLVR